MGYEAYALHTGGKTFDGRDMPTWDELPDSIKLAWGSAASAVFDFKMEKIRGDETPVPPSKEEDTKPGKF